MKVAINGLGRIGRLALKIGLDKGVDFVAVNELGDARNIAYLMKYDSVYGRYDKKIEIKDGFLIIGNKKIHYFSEKDPEKLPWKKLGVDIVIESTGVFTESKEAERHIKAGAKKVIISAPGKNCKTTLILGVNEKSSNSNDKVISMGSCTTNCLAPVVKILDDNFGIESGFLTTVHAYTSTQALVDSPNKSLKLRRGRAAASNIIPTTTGATQSVVEAIPKLKGKLNGMAMRVPVLSGSIIDFVAVLKKSPTKEQVNNAFKSAASKEMKGILEYTEDEIVSSDIIKNPHSAIIDGLSTQVIGNTVKVLAWYDNEYGYSTRLIEMAKFLSKIK